MLRKAAELAGEAGDAALVCQTVDRMVTQFQLDGLAVKEKLLARLALRAKDADGIKSLVESTDALVDQAVAEDRLELALDLVNTAARVCQKAQGAAFRKQLSERRKEVQTFKKEWEQIAPTLETVKANPEDADANLGAGRWYCFSKGDWAKGLPYLTKGSDEGFKALAVRELAIQGSEQGGSGSPSNPQSLIPNPLSLADGWWDAGQKAKGRARAAILVHAGTGINRRSRTCLRAC